MTPACPPRRSSDLVRCTRSREPPYRCQGRGSAANSIVCFLLGVTSVDPLQHDLLFSRFVSEDRGEPPDIDVDFEHERREEVMQYVRSEEHTSELQSLMRISYAVFCLKKKTQLHI